MPLSAGPSAVTSPDARRDLLEVAREAMQSASPSRGLQQSSAVVGEVSLPAGGIGSTV